MQYTIEQFNPTKKELTELAEKYKGLEIKDENDHAGYMMVDTARKDLKEKRVFIKKTAKEMRDEANKFAKDVIALEKDLIAIIEPLEQELQLKQVMIDNKKELPERIKALKDIEVVIEESVLVKMNNREYTKFYDDEKIKFFNRKEQERLEREREEQRKKEIAEAEKRAKEEAEKKAKEEQARIETEAKEREEAMAREAKEREKRIKQKAKEDKARLEREAKEREERIKREAEEEKQRLIQEQKAKEEAEKRRIEQEAQKAKEEKERAEKNKKYQEWKAKNNFNEKTDIINRDGNTFTMYRVVDTITI